MESFDLKGFLFEIRRFWLLSAIIVSLAICIGFVLHMFSAPVYESDAKMVVNGKLNIPSASAFNDGQEREGYIGTQATIMQSRDVTEAAQKELLRQGKTPPEKPVVLRATYIPKTFVFLLSANGTDSEYTQAYLREAITAFVNLRKKMRADQTAEAFSALMDEEVRFRAEVDSATKDLNDFQHKVTVGSLEEELASENNYILNLRKRVAELRVQKSVALTGSPDHTVAPDPSVAAAAALDPNNLNGGSIAQQGQGGLQSDQQLLAAKQTASSLRSERRRLLANLRPSHPKIRQLDVKISDTQNQIQFLNNEIKNSGKEHLGSIDSEIEAMGKEIADREKRLGTLNQNVAEFQNLKDRLANARETYQRLMASAHNVDVSRQIDQEVITVLEAPSTPYSIRTRLYVVLAEAAAVGSAIGIALTFLLSKLTPRFQTLDQIKRTLQLPIYGKVLRDPWIARNRTVLDCTRRHIGFAESFRTLRSAMLHLPEAHRDRRCIAVTSALPAEGKTTVAVNLAIALAAANRTVLLIDTDLRRGSLHQRLKARQGPGLSDLITSQNVRPGEVIHPTRMPNLMLLPSGPRVEGVSEAIVRFEFDRMLQELGQQFDYVILDLPPVLATDDAPTLCTYADWAIFVVRLHYSSPNETLRALEELAIRQIEVPGVVVNAVRTRDTGHGYYHRFMEHQLEDRPFLARQALPASKAR
jgi:succinoglycan biosynthesis transport protein ExoP